QLPDPAIVIPYVLQFGMLIAGIDDPQGSLVAWQERLAIHLLGDDDIEANEFIYWELDGVVVESGGAYRRPGRPDQIEEIAHQETIEPAHPVGNRGRRFQASPGQGSQHVDVETCGAIDIGPGDRAMHFEHGRPKARLQPARLPL